MISWKLANPFAHPDMHTYFHNERTHRNWDKHISVSHNHISRKINRVPNHLHNFKTSTPKPVTYRDETRTHCTMTRQKWLIRHHTLISMSMQWINSVTRLSLTPSQAQYEHEEPRRLFHKQTAQSPDSESYTMQTHSSRYHAEG